MPSGPFQSNGPIISPVPRSQTTWVNRQNHRPHRRNRDTSTRPLDLFRPCLSRPHRNSVRWVAVSPQAMHGPAASRYVSGIPCLSLLGTLTLIPSSGHMCPSWPSQLSLGRPLPPWRGESPAGYMVRWELGVGEWGGDRCVAHSAVLAGPGSGWIGSAGRRGTLPNAQAGSRYVATPGAWSMRGARGRAYSGDGEWFG
jgi:hypothetical protein